MSNINVTFGWFLLSTIFHQQVSAPSFTNANCHTSLCVSLHFSNQSHRMLHFLKPVNKRPSFPCSSDREKGYRRLQDQEEGSSWKSKLMVYLTRISLISFRRFRNKEHTMINSLNDGLLTRIYEHLPLVDKACLSLTCKRLFGLFGTVTKDTKFVFPRLLYIRVPILCVNSKDVPRNQLLLRLENRRWAYCAHCLKLHPRKEFTRSDLGSPSLERRCSLFAGIVDLCPCNSLTLRQRDHIIELLESPTTPSGMEYGNFHFERGERPKMVHDCLFRFTFGCTFQCSIHLTVKHPDGLAVSTLYTIWFPPSILHLTPEPICACPHRDLMSLIRQNRVAEFCFRCCTDILRSPRRAQIPNQEIFSVQRVLGNAKCPSDGVFGRQSIWRGGYRLTGAQYSTTSEPW